MFWKEYFVRETFEKKNLYDLATPHRGDIHELLKLSQTLMSQWNFIFLGGGVLDVQGPTSQTLK